VSELYQDPNWPRAGAWLRGEVPAGRVGSLAILGVPANRGSITPGRCDLAPAAIRKALDRYSTFDLADSNDVRDLAVHDLGDLDLGELNPGDAVQPIEKAVAAALPDHEAVILLGGDNSITFPGVQALDRNSDCGLITFDAHLDLRDIGNGLTNGNPIRALLAKGFPGDRIVQIGIQSFSNSKAYLDIAQDAGITSIGADEVRLRGIEDVVRVALQSFTEGVVYVDLDMDVLDRAFAPATPGSRPGGLTPSDLRTAARICGEFARVRVLDIVEIDPTQDIADQTSLCAAACILAFASGVHKRCSRSLPHHS
jgi:formiminoglutamase